MSLTVTSGIVGGAVKAVPYGPEGVGKTTFASKWPRPVFIDVEGGTRRYDVARMPDPRNWTMLLAEIDEAADNPGDLGTLVIDTVDAAEEMCVAHVLEKYNKSSMEDWAYQAGWRYVYEEFRKFLGKLDRCVSAGVNVLVLAHATIVKFEQPDEQGSYDRYELKLHKGKSTNNAALLKEWSDLLLFMNFKTDVMRDEKTGKTHASGGTKRVMYAQRRAAYDAKNRFGLPASMPLDFDEIKDALFATAEGAGEPKTAPEPETGAKTPTAASQEPTGASDATETAADGDGKGAPSVLDGAKVTEVTPENVRELRKLMERDGVADVWLAQAVADNPKNSYTADNRIADYTPKFIDSLVAHWDAVSKKALAYSDPYSQDYIPFD